jgi:PAS domain S-box-containing protein
LNEKWQVLCGFTPSEVQHKSPKELLQGDKTDTAKARAFAEEIHRAGTAKTTLANYTKAGELFVLQLTSTRVTDRNGNVFYFTEGREVCGPAPHGPHLGRYHTAVSSAARATLRL